ncbi:haloacetate dehalogenase [Agaricicola taiwanensis]|uniref:Haloacetate dehalogenase n=1 Tax=Agaricicola taiwanensis TaxID=591372 RepID=A0A8J2VNP4_9RHOB|nr:alpha/beta hydrolase [Agaricicola taiwanensis]GGE34280.1 haloacetate dehalogenase [Agaricicola taiwanensis]
MPENADLFPGFQSEWIDTDGGRFFARVGGKGPALLLLHGYPQTHVMWHRLAPGLSERFTLIMPDLPGYGWSFVPRAADDHRPHSKRVWAAALVDLMERLGHVRFGVIGHDRGARTAYRMALDHPGRIDRLALLDIIPTEAMWTGMTAKLAMKSYHWLFLAQPHPLPETLIGKDPDFYLDWTLASWTATSDLSAFDHRALAQYRAGFRSPDRIRSACEDYRAGQSVDLADDQADLETGKKITVPLLALWGERGFPGETSGPLSIWQRWGDEVTGAAITSGHFLAEENPGEALTSLLHFFAPEA